MKKTSANIDKYSTANLVRRMVSTYLKPHFVKLFQSILFMAIAAAMTAGIAMLTEPIIDKVLGPNGGVKYIWPVGGAIMVVFIVRGLSTYIHTVLTAHIGQNIVASIQKDLFSHFMKLDLAFFHANPSGQLVSSVTNDVTVMRVAVTSALTGLGKNLLTLIFLIGVMFYKDWQLSIAAFIIFPFAAMFVIYLGRRLRKISRKTQSEMASLTDILSQIFQGVRQVQAYGMEKHERRRSSNVINKVRDLNIKSVKVSNLSTPVNDTLIGLVMMGIIIYGGYQSAAGAMTAGQLMSFLAAFTLAYEPMKKLAKLNGTLQTGLGAAERVFALIDRKPMISQKRGAKTLKTRSPQITFEQVNFRYDGEEEKALDNVSFTAKPGTVTALVGPSGSGKTTIVNLIPRFYDPLEGDIAINNKNLRDLSLSSLRFHIALVSQDITIFDESVYNNIAYGLKGAKEKDVIKAAKAAAAHEFIEELSDGYDTVLGEDGVKLSGGQRQRISIARAILRNAPILLLDEATSALDNESEALIQKALERLQKGRTTIVIAHRLSTVKNADQIIVMDQGAVVEKGSHQSLIKKKGLYAKMHATGLKST